jgi:hypothetical protein
MFERDFFTGDFADRARQFLDRDGGIAVEFVTVGGEHLDVLSVESLESEGMTLVTRSERLVFLPYAQIALVEMKGERDHRIASFQLPEGPT